MSHIDWEAKNDHDLLVNAVIGINGICERLDKLNNSVAKNTKRSIQNDTRLDAVEEDIDNLKKCDSKPRINWQMISVLIAFAGGLIFVLVKVLGG